jgi:hypothetical protein
MKWLSLIVLVAVLVPILTLPNMGCSRNTGPSWVDHLMEEFENQPVANPPLSIWQYVYEGQVVYYVPPRCCDIYSTLYDSEGSVLCHPDGGFTGEGDGQCRDFFEKRTDAKLIWQDVRSYP